MCALIVGCFLPIAGLAIYDLLHFKNRAFFVLVIVNGALLTYTIQRLRLQIGPDGFAYRHGGGSGRAAFKDLTRAYVEVTRWGIPALSVESRNLERHRIPSPGFSVAALAALLTALEEHDIYVQVSKNEVARRLIAKVRVAQGKK
jgi:hypothetical protein